MLPIEISFPISVITVCYNAEYSIESTIKSIVEQTYKNIEYIVIDGGSTDSTVEVIKKYADKIAYWVTEPDNGIYDAMNKGIEKATGDYIIFVNSGDYLYENTTLQQVAEYINTTSDYDMIYGRSKIITTEGHITDLIVNHGIGNIWKGPCFRHGALLAKTSVLKGNNFELTPKLKIAADFDFIYKAFKKGCRFQEIDVVVVAFQAEGASDNPYRHIKDSVYILKKYGDWNLKTKLYYLYKYCRVVLSQSIFQKIFKVIKIFFHDYFSNYWINKIPFYFIRHFYYKKVMGITIGKGSSIHLRCFLYGANILIGENSTINRNCYLDGRGRLVIGNNVSVSPDVQLITEDHDYNSSGFTGRSRDVIIDDYVWIGTKAMILPGVHIGKGAVICAGAIVTKSVGEYDVVAGIPAVKIKERNRNLNYNPSWMPYFD